MSRFEIRTGRDQEGQWFSVWDSMTGRTVPFGCYDTRDRAELRMRLLELREER